MVIDLPIIDKGLKIGKINVKTKEINVYTDNSIYFTCTSKVDCCSRMRIPVSEFDISKIEEHGYELDQIIQELSPVFIQSKSPNQGKEKVYLLKKKPFDQTCTFLNNTLCEIHEFKPFACKIYPFSLDFLENNDIEILIHTEQLCRSIKSASTEESNNYFILNNILKMILEEVEMRNIIIE